MVDGRGYTISSPCDLDGSGELKKNTLGKQGKKNNNNKSFLHGDVLVMSIRHMMRHVPS